MAACKKPAQKSVKNAFAEAVATIGATGHGKKTRKAETGTPRFTPREVTGVLKILEGLQLPLPQNEEEFMAGREGCIIFMNHTGTVIRIEQKNPDVDIYDSDEVLQPLGRFESGTAVVKICAACGFESDANRRDALKKALEEQGLKMSDSGLRQMGRIPCRTPEYPDGKTVVVDLGAVQRLTQRTAEVKVLLQEEFYGPLRQKIAEAYDGQNFDAAKVKEFWALCEGFVAQNKLIAGWNDYTPLCDNWWETKNGGIPKALQAAAKAKAYAVRFQR